MNSEAFQHVTLPVFNRFKDIHVAIPKIRKSLAGEDTLIKLLIIGASGMTGRALLEAAVACVWFQVIAFTRNRKHLMDNQHVTKGEVKIVEGDMLEQKTLQQAMVDVDVVFFTTFYWETRNSECEYQQGLNVVEAATKAHIKHLLYVGTPYANKYAEVKCKLLIGRERVQKLVLKSGVPSTVIQMGFYYENLLSLFKPHPVDKTTYALALPMENLALNCGSILDFAHCIAKIILQPAAHFGQIIKLSTGHHTVTQLAAWLDRHFPNLNFYDPKIPMEEYKKIIFDGSEEIYSWFMSCHAFPCNLKWDQKQTYQLCPSARSFQDWLEENDKVFLQCLEEETEGSNLEPDVGGESNTISSSTYEKWNISESLKPGESKKLNTMVVFRTREEENNFERRAVLCNEVTVRWSFLDLWSQLFHFDG
ncbi:nmra-like family domain-containing protein 1 [Plakobranchus ocellatus]|uniref:NmrA-like family domain-containing protein 1 n=1 Tax=Plakobranchus ocellatus TaxID=259542 RepID=A0AAV4A6K1_9GAST|nr:nmra-like family domain-containing protein 1 [Plakobranchus ocellatus]